MKTNHMPIPRKSKHSFALKIAYCLKQLKIESFGYIQISGRVVWLIALSKGPHTENRELISIAQVPTFQKLSVDAVIDKQNN